MNNQDLLRFSRHILLPEVDIKGQETWLNAHVIVVGCGGLGSVFALYATAAGIGKLTLIDDDSIELSNLQRQIAFSEKDIGSFKADVLKEQCLARRANVDIQILKMRATKDQLTEFMNENFSNKLPNIWVIDCSDNFSTRYALNDFCADFQLPLISGAATAMQGQVMLLYPGKKNNPCYRCLFPQEVEEHPTVTSCHEAGVLSPLIAVIAGLQLGQLLKALAVKDHEHSFIWQFNIWQAEWKKSKIMLDPECSFH